MPDALDNMCDESGQLNYIVIVKGRGMYFKLGKVKFCMETIFILFFLIYAFLSFNSFTYGKRCISIALYVTLVMGGAVLIKNILTYRLHCRKTPGLILMGLFLLSVLFSITLKGTTQTVKENLIKLIFQVFFFYILYLPVVETSKKCKDKEFKLICSFINIYIFIGALISLYLMWSGYSKMTKLEGGWSIGIGFVWGRLWGIYTEPNYITIVSVIVILINLYWMKNKTSIRMSCFSIINILAQYLFICFSDSRTGAVTLGVSLGVYFFNNKLYKSIVKGTLRKKIIPVLCGMMIICVSGILLPRMTVKLYNTGIEFVRHNKIATSAVAVTAPPKQNSSKSANVTAPMVDRGYDTSADISNRRFDIWKSGLEIFMTTPLTGTSFSNILGYTQEQELDTYIVNNGAEKFSTMHNEILNILVSQGIWGVIILAFLIFVILVKILPSFYKAEIGEFRRRNLIFSSLISVISGSMFLTGMFYSNSPSSIIFWYFLGFLLYSIYAKKE